MIHNAFGLIYTGESNLLLRDLTYSRSLAAVPFGGRYRCIDFVLSSLVNTGITNVGLIAQRNYHSLMDHLGSGKEWDLHRKRDGLFILPPFLTRENTGLYRGTIDALRSVMGYIRRSSQRYVVLTGSHTLFNTTFEEMISRHIDTGADITIMYNHEAHSAQDFDTFDDLRLCVDERGRITDMQLNPYHPGNQLRSCDVYVMEKTLLEYLVEEAATRAQVDFIRDILIKRIHSLRIYGWRYEGYVGRLESLNSYFRHNMALLNQEVRRDLFNSDHPIYTKVKDEVPARYAGGGMSRNSIVADGCIIEGKVENSVLFRGVRVGAQSVVRDSIIMQACDIREQCMLNNVIMDKGVIVGRGRHLAGYEACPIVLRKGLVI